VPPLWSKLPGSPADEGVWQTGSRGDPIAGVAVMRRTSFDAIVRQLTVTWRRDAALAGSPATSRFGTLQEGAWYGWLIVVAAPGADGRRLGLLITCRATAWQSLAPTFQQIVSSFHAPPAP
jgi:hypothetical protein